METTLEKRKLNSEEVDLLVQEIKKFPNPLTSKKTWQSLEKVYITRTKDDLIGVCAINQLENWIKLGPFVVFKKYHELGFGEKILKTITKDYSKASLFIGSRNPVVAKIAISLGFHEITTIWILPKTIKLYLIKNILKNLSFDFVKEFIRKKPTREGSYRFFLKQKSLHLSSK